LPQIPERDGKNKKEEGFVGGGKGCHPPEARFLTGEKNKGNREKKGEEGWGKYYLAMTNQR